MGGVAFISPPSRASALRHWTFRFDIRYSFFPFLLLTYILLPWYPPPALLLPCSTAPLLSSLPSPLYAIRYTPYAIRYTLYAKRCLFSLPFPSFVVFCSRKSQWQLCGIACVNGVSSSSVAYAAAIFAFLILIFSLNIAPGSRNHTRDTILCRSLPHEIVKNYLTR